jgi:uncharacterized tellurite resistance protein B-like protein
MIEALKALFEPPERETPEQREHRQHLAAAALLIETTRADFKQDKGEQAALQGRLSATLGLSPAEVGKLVVQATRQVDQSTSLYEFTRVINDHYSAAQKLQLIGDMWAVAYADGHLDKHEEHLIRRISDLIYVPHTDYIRSKLQAQPGTDTSK